MGSKRASRCFLSWIKGTFIDYVKGQEQESSEVSDTERRCRSDREETADSYLLSTKVEAAAKAAPRLTKLHSSKNSRGVLTARELSIKAILRALPIAVVVVHYSLAQYSAHNHYPIRIHSRVISFEPVTVQIST